MRSRVFVIVFRKRNYTKNLILHGGFLSRLLDGDLWPFTGIHSRYRSSHICLHFELAHLTLPGKEFGRKTQN